MYNEIADLYHLVYEDWNTAIERQASALDQVISGLIGRPPHRLLDVSCGIGTQALGLAARNYHVSASDLSAGAVARARREAQCRGLAIDFSVADMRDCAKGCTGAYDVVLSADNSIPHLEGQPEIFRALNGFFDCLRPGGLCLVGVRDYAAENDRTTPQMRPYGFREHAGHRYFVFQTRDLRDDGYDVAMACCISRSSLVADPIREGLLLAPHLPPGIHLKTVVQPLHSLVSLVLSGTERLARNGGMTPLFYLFAEAATPA